YLKAVMDAIFDSTRYMGTIMWKRTSAHNDSKSWGRVADYILCYGKRRLNVNDIKVDLDPKNIRTKYRYTDARGQYRLDNLTAKGLSGGGYMYGYHGHQGPWRFPQERMLELEGDGRIVIPARGRGNQLPVPQLKRYLTPESGQSPGNVWVDINPANSQARERTQWKTQKPEALLRRIILASSRPAQYDDDGNLTREADWVLDPFCGCATACIVAEDLERNWIGIDLEPQAESVLRQRLFVRAKRHHTQLMLEEYKGDFTTRSTPPTRSEYEDDEKIHPDLNDFLYELQEHRCNGCGRELDVIDMESDHIVPSSKGGEKYTERNRNLLCGRCNRRKSNKYTIAELREILKKEDQIAFDMSTLDPKREIAFQQRRLELRRRRINRGES
ncbi:MAG: hypothetical protein F4045_12425, partial [Chloroflexi bacterium]|nr:hypothetical protein [Chloroflexota bacterium]